MRQKHHYSTKNHGFTLMELSVVFVIIGLLAAGVIMSKEMIFTAGIRRQIRQVEDYTIAYGTFKLKYHCMPGDCINASKQFPTAVNGNGNNLIEATAILAPNTPNRSADNNFDLEQKNFFTHLQLAELIRSDISLVGPGYPEATLAPGQGFTAASDFQNLVTLALHANDYTSQSRDYLATGQWQAGLYFAVGDPNAAWGWKNDTKGLFTPLVMYSIDSKMDDGNPQKGKLRAGTIEWTNQNGGNDGYCLDNSPDSNTVYTNVAAAFPNATWDKYLISNTQRPCIFAWQLE